MKIISENFKNSMIFWDIRPIYRGKPTINKESCLPEQRVPLYREKSVS